MALPKLCSVEGCDKPVRARGWCCNHYALWERNGAPVYQPKKPIRRCNVTGCGGRSTSRRGHCGTHAWRLKHHGSTDKPVRPELPAHCRLAGCDNPRAVGCKGMCEAHYQRERKRGDALAPRLVSKRGEPRCWLETHVHYRGEGCLTWPFARHSSGEAAIGDRQSRQAARIMCILAHGEPPSPSHQAAHNCGKGHLACVNPRHLRWATPKENCADKRAHGTQLNGEAHKFAKLTVVQVRAIRALHPDFSAAELAEAFGVHSWTIRDIVDRRTWQCLA
jgi:hypothetical protein